MQSFMKYGMVVASLATTVVCQSASQFPPCSIKCFTSLLENDSCSPPTNFQCQCALPDLYTQLSSCVFQACDQTDADNFLNGYISSCKSVGVTVPGAPSTVVGEEASSTSVASTRATSSAPTKAPTTYSTSAPTTAPTSSAAVETQSSSALETPTSSAAVPGSSTSSSVAESRSSSAAVIVSTRSTPEGSSTGSAASAAAESTSSSAAATGQARSSTVGSPYGLPSSLVNTASATTSGAVSLIGVSSAPSNSIVPFTGGASSLPIMTWLTVMVASITAAYVL